MGCGNSKPPSQNAEKPPPADKGDAAPLNEGPPPSDKGDAAPSNKGDAASSDKGEDNAASPSNKGEDKGDAAPSNEGPPPADKGDAAPSDKGEDKGDANKDDALNLDDIRMELLNIMDKDDYDDGSLGPVFIRLAWHSSGTYDKTTGKGGSNGATMRFAPEKDDVENAGLNEAIAFLEPVRAKFPAISIADLWIFASYVFIEASGGPKIEFRSGRKDITDNELDKVPENGFLPKADLPSQTQTDSDDMAVKEAATIAHVRSIFNRLGFDDKEIVALMSGGHVYGRCHKERSGYAGPWVEEMTKFSNEYAADMIEDDWAAVTSESLDCPEEMRPISGKTQWVNEGGKGTQMMIKADMVLLWDPDFRTHLEVYAKDEEALKADFGAAFKKLTELGVPL